MEWTQIVTAVWEQAGNGQPVLAAVLWMLLDIRRIRRDMAELPCRRKKGKKRDEKTPEETADCFSGGN
jgi:hypothetical protein